MTVAKSTSSVTIAGSTAKLRTTGPDVEKMGFWSVWETILGSTVQIARTPISEMIATFTATLRI